MNDQQRKAMFAKRMKIENLNLIKDKGIAMDIQSKVNQIDKIFEDNGMAGGMVFSSLKNSVNGQIQISLDKKPDHYVNRLSDFYIDDRVGFRGTRRVSELVQGIGEDIAQVMKERKSKLMEGDIVEPNSDHPSNVVLRDRIVKEPDLKLKIVKIEQGLDPHYTGFYAVSENEKPFKKNWIYVGSDDIRKINGGK